MTKAFESRKLFAVATLLFAAATIFTHATRNVDSNMVSAIHLRVPDIDAPTDIAPGTASGGPTLALNLHSKK
jgi:hypothetical protein